MPPLLYEILKVTFRYPIVILMLGDWQHGKTDTSFLVAYLAKKWGLINKIGSNTFTYNNPDVDEITASNELKNWLHADKSIKLFIFDEALKHAYRRKAMSQKNVEIITEVLPELSKGEGRIIFCSQTEKIDTDMIHPAFCRSVWKKKSKKVMVCMSKHHATKTFYNLPRSPIRFDPHRTAPFIVKKMSKKPDFQNMGQVYEIARMRLEGATLSDIGDKFKMHPEQVRRELNKALKRFVDYEESKAVDNGKIESRRENGDRPPNP